MQALWRLQLTSDGSPCTTMERLAEVPPLLLTLVVRNALTHLQKQDRNATVTMAIELTCKFSPGDQNGLCEELREEGWQYPDGQQSPFTQAER